MPYKPIKTRCLEIIDYWNTRVYEGDMGVDWADSIIHNRKKAKGCGGDRNFVCVNGLLEEQNLVCDDGTSDWTRLKELKIPSKNLRFRCWMCSGITKSIERCHIHARQFGGTDEPSNLVLLCFECHQKSPDIKNDKEAIWEWIKATKKPFYDTLLAYEAFDEFEKIYGYDFLSEESPIIKKLSNSKDKQKVITKFIKDINKITDEQAGIHGFTTSPSTLAMLMKKVM